MAVGELNRRRGPRWSQGYHPGRGCGPRRAKGVAYGGVGLVLPKLEASSALSQHSPPPSPCGRPGVLPALAFSPIARQTDGRGGSAHNRGLCFSGGRAQLLKLPGLESRRGKGRYIFWARTSPPPTPQVFPFFARRAAGDPGAYVLSWRSWSGACLP